MNATIISIGNELLNGHTINTNAAFIARQLHHAGINIVETLAIKDEPEAIQNAIKHAEEISELAISTGGLGPTTDDISKKAICEYFGTQLIWSEEIWQHILNLFKHRNIKISDTNKTQAWVPKQAHLFYNRLGTAPGFLLRKNHFSLIALPGVPFEMENLIIEEIVPYLLKTNKITPPFSQTYLFSNISESLLAEKVAEWDQSFHQNGFDVAYLPQPGLIKFKLSCSNLNPSNQSILKEFKTFCQKELQDFLVSEIDLPIAAILGNVLKSQKKTLSTAESCTGGNIAHHITSIAGSSEYFKGSVVAYSNEVKTNVLKVNPTTLEQFGAVSEQVVLQMAKGAIELLNSDFSIAVSGIAGPNGGTEEKPVGTTWIAVASKYQIITKKNIFGSDRIRNIERATIEGMFMLLKMIKNS